MKTQHRQLIQNAIFVSEEDLYLKSTHVHDYVVHEPRKGYSWSVDGGLDYLRRGWGPINKRDSFVEWSLYLDDSFETIAAKLLWGTYGKEGKGPLRYRPIAALELDHLQAILKTQDHIEGGLHQKVVCYWLAKKGGKP